MIERVVRRVQSANIVDRVVVATDDVRIQEAVENFGGEVIMTSVECENGEEFWSFFLHARNPKLFSSFISCKTSQFFFPL